MFKLPGATTNNK